MNVKKELTRIVQDMVIKKLISISRLQRNVLKTVGQLQIRQTGERGTLQTHWLIMMLNTGKSTVQIYSLQSSSTTQLTEGNLRPTPSSMLFVQHSLLLQRCAESFLLLTTLNTTWSLVHLSLKTDGTLGTWWLSVLLCFLVSSSHYTATEDMLRDKWKNRWVYRLRQLLIIMYHFLKVILAPKIDYDKNSIFAKSD